MRNLLEARIESTVVTKRGEGLFFTFGSKWGPILTGDRQIESPARPRAAERKEGPPANIRRGNTPHAFDPHPRYLFSKGFAVAVRKVSPKDRTLLRLPPRNAIRGSPWGRLR